MRNTHSPELVVNTEDRRRTASTSGLKGEDEDGRRFRRLRRVELRLWIIALADAEYSSSSAPSSPSTRFMLLYHE